MSLENSSFSVIKLQDTSIPIHDVVELIHLSFKERIEQGINFSCSNIGIPEFIERTKDGIVFLAIDNKTGELLGEATTRLRRNAKRQLFGENVYVAIHPKAKRRGIASALFKEQLAYLQLAKAEYIISYTAEKAASSVAYHLKNGFHIIGLRSFRDNDYYSFLFRYQIKKKTLLQRAYSSRFLCRIRFIVSSIITRTMLHKDGSLTRLGRLLRFKG